MDKLFSLNGVVFILTKDVEFDTENTDYAIQRGWVQQSNSYSSRDSWFYKNAFDYSHKAAHFVIDARKGLQNAILE